MKQNKDFYLQMKAEAVEIVKAQEYRLEVAKKMLKLAEENLKKFK